jgi:peptide/nickel transport system permease protein
MEVVLAYVRRVLQTLPVLIGLSLIAFLLGHFAPGDPAYFALVIDGFSEPTELEVASMRKELGLDKPLVEQYLRWASRAAQGDLGKSFRSGRSILDDLSQRLPITLSIAIPALLFAAVGGITLGTLAGNNPDSLMSSAVEGLSGVLIATPSFLLGIAAITLIAENISWLPVAGIGSTAHLILPVMTLSAGAVGVSTRLMRSAIIEEKSKRYVSYTYSRGVSSLKALVSHILPNSLPTVITYLTNVFAGIIGGSVIIESIFALPGLGSYVIQAVLNRDLPAVQGYVLITGIAYICAQLCADLLLLVLDPRVRAKVPLR